MKKKLLITILFIIASASIFTACQKEDLGETITTLVTGRMDSVYKGEASEEYMALVDTTLVDIEKDYQARLKTEALYFCNYMGILESGDETSYDALPEETRNALESMLQKVNETITYEVRDPEKEADGSYSAELIVTPCDIFTDVVTSIQEGNYEPYKAFVNNFNTVEGSQETFAKDLAEVLVNLTEETLETYTAPPSKTYVIEVEEQNGAYTMDQDIWESIDEGMIIYP